MMDTVHDTGHRTARASAVAGSASSDVSMQDWDILFDAVAQRLKSTVDYCSDATPRKRHDSWLHIRADVLECVEALDQLHRTASHEFARHPVARSLR